MVKGMLARHCGHEKAFRDTFPTDLACNAHEADVAEDSIEVRLMARQVQALELAHHLHGAEQIWRSNRTTRRRVGQSTIISQLNKNKRKIAAHFKNTNKTCR